MPYSTYGKNRMLNAIKNAAVLAATGQATGDTITSNGHGLANGDIVTFLTLTGGTGLSTNTPYYVVGQTANTFQVATTQGGTAVDITVNYTDITFTRGAIATHLGLYTKGADITSVTSTGTPDTFTKTSHGLNNGDIIIFTAVTGGTGLVAGNASNANNAAHPYYVISSAANTFQIALLQGGTAVDLSSDVSAATVNKLTEVSGGAPAYARKTVTFSDAIGGTMDDASNGTPFDVPATTVNIVSLHAALTGGPLLAMTQVTQEVFGAQGTYTVTDADLDLLNGAGA